MKYFDKFLDVVDKGIEGEAIWIPVPYKRLQNTLGLTKKTYTIVGGDPGCLGKGTPIMMYDGSIKKVEDVEVGDKLMGPDSKPRTVQSLKRGTEQMYWVRQNSAMDYRVNESHILSLKRQRRKYSKKVVPGQLDIPKNKRKRKYELINQWTELNNIKVSDYLKQNKTFKDRNKGWRPDVIHFNNYNTLLIDPYFLGLWLGDGTSENTSITNIDKEIIDYIYDFASNNKLDVNNYHMSYTLSKGRGKYNHLRERFKYHSLLNNKHIPHDFKTSSLNNRLELLAGLIDSDGHLSKGSYHVTSKYKNLAKQIKFVALSCGFNSEVNIKTVNDVDYYRVSITGDLSTIPVKIDRKKSTKNTIPTGVGRSGFTLEKDTIDQYYGFTLDKDHLFCLGDFTVTHNTGKSSFVDTSYILGSYAWMLDNVNSSVKPHIILRSMERSKEYRIAKWVCKRMFEQYGILLDVNTIFGRHTEDNRITKDIREKIESIKEYFDKMQEYVTIIDGSSNPTGVFKDFLDYALKNGTLYINDPDKGLKIAVYHPKDKKITWKVIPKDRFPEDEVFPERYEKSYIPDDSEELVIPIVDHIGEYSNENGNTDKQNLDVAGSYTLRLRDIYGWSPIDVVQFNRNLSDQRRRQGNSLRPEEQDFMGSSTMYQRCDVALALFNPHKYNISNHIGYNVQKFINYYGYNRFRSLWILKNTYGNADVGTGMAFYGEIGHYTQIPKSNEIMNIDQMVNISDNDNVVDLIVR